MDCPERARNLHQKAALRLLVCVLKGRVDWNCYWAALRGQSPALCRHIRQSSVSFRLATYHVFCMYMLSTESQQPWELALWCLPILRMRKWKREKLLVQGLTVRKMGAQTTIPGPASTPVSFLSLCAPALSQASCLREIGIQYSTTKACHGTHSWSQRHICSFCQNPKGAFWVVKLGSLAGSGDTSIWWEGAAGLGSGSLPKAGLSALCCLRGPLGFPYQITSLFILKWHCLIAI